MRKRRIGQDVSVAIDLGNATPAAAPPAVRATRPGWRDPRLWVGVALVAVCVVAGARLLGSSDDTTAVWTLRHDVAAGAVVTPGDLVAAQVRLDDAGSYLTGPPPARMHLDRPVGQGELLPRSAIAGGEGTEMAELPLTLDPAALPADVGPGSAVDVYVAGQGAPAAAPVLAGVAVVDVVPGGALDGSTQVTVALPATDVAAYFSRLHDVSDPELTVVGRS
jgi:hypothetical protein